MIRNVTVLVGVVLLALGGYWFALRDESAVAPPAGDVLYYKDPMGGPETSSVPKKDSMGMDYLPVYATQKAASKEPAAGKGRILYYRNPMGLADTSAVPKKDTMGMDYIPVYESDVSQAGSIQIDTRRIQRSGVRTATAQLREMAGEVQVAGVVAFDETRYAVVAPRVEGWVERVLVGASGLSVKAGQILAEVYSPELVQLEEEHRIAREAMDVEAASSLAESALKRLQNLGVTQAQMTHIRAGRYSRTFSLSAPITGVVMKKNVVPGQRFVPGDQLYEIVDISAVWVVAKVFERDLSAVGIGSNVQINLLSLPDRTYDGTVSFISPQIDRDTRTADVRIKVPNPDGILRADMFASVVIHTALAATQVSVQSSAIIDSGTRQLVFIAKGDGRFEPRQVKAGIRSEGYTAITDGLKDGEEVVIEAAFLIDAESNLLSAGQSLAPTAPGVSP